MCPEVKASCLMEYLKERNPIYHNKILEVRKNLDTWLSMVPATFPHYTNHTLRHSDEIVLELSKLLFAESDYDRPVVKLSSIEAYILCASAYLHDAGMVVSEKEKAEILASNDWRQFVANGSPAGKRWKEIESFRGGKIPEDVGVRNFLADVQTRFLVAEFVRRIHHRRTAEIIAQHDLGLGAFSFGDSVLRDTISNVCLAHGLDRYELLDTVRFPERRDIQNETVNVRFLAFMLRIGDLLDMSSDRACPLLLNAASPIPSDSLAHWTKYQRITHKLTAPDRIELSASCANQDEHRFLNDWCQWLVDEVTEAGIAMNRALRHSDWEPPEISIVGDAKTIKIEPDLRSNYIPSTWRFILDENVVFERLIRDVYDHPFAFVRELVQNALDATRCQVYLDLREKSLGQPEFSTQVDEETRNRYPVRISLTTKTSDNELSGAKEEYQVLTVEDYGIGMDKNIIANYLLQVGRSFYSTDEFRRNFGFVPSSRFGIGFLSVFAASDNVIMETFKPSSQSNDGALRLTLTGPRKYLLTEKGTRKRSGTKIEVLIRKSVESEELIKSILFWCKRVEFPIIVNVLGKEMVIKAEKPEDFEYEIPVTTQEKTTIKLKAYPVQGHGIQGEIYVLSVIAENVDRWDMSHWVRYEYPYLHPAAKSIRIPENLICVNGIAFDYSGFGREYAYRMDIRRKMPEMPISRSPYHVVGRRHLSRLIPELEACVKGIVLKHFDESEMAKSEDGWIYKNRVADEFKEFPFWDSMSGMVKVEKEGKHEEWSLSEVIEEPIVTLVIEQKYIKNIALVEPAKVTLDTQPTLRNVAIGFDDFGNIAADLRDRIFDRRKCSSVRLLSGRKLTIDWRKCSDEEIAKYRSFDFLLVDLENPNLLGICLGSEVRKFLLNLRNPIVKWLVLLRDACEKGTKGLKPEQFEKTWEVLTAFIRSSNANLQATERYIKGWQEVAWLPSDLKPPSTKIDPDMILDIELFRGKSAGVVS
jgi:hypothetical protein